jgi:NAD(P)-dependent dehydrogenase (short-subunit alcohol dehydrogenase family)
MRALVTGCSTGIGRAAAVELARRGHEVIATARRPEALGDLDVAERLALDVTDDASVRDALGAAGRVDALVNNAGWGAGGPVEKVPLAAVRRMFETNFFGAVRLVQAVLPAMRERGAGVIVNVSSISGRVAPPLSGFYAATKFALEALSEALHFEVGHFGIRVVIVEPGYIDTPFRENSELYGLDTPPYDALDRVFSGSDGRLLGGPRPGPELVGAAIADAVEGKDQRLRQPVGRDAELVLGARDELDDAAFEAAMRQTLGLDW